MEVWKQMQSQLESPSAERQSPELHSLVHSYLATLLALSESLEIASPVGGPHMQRLGRLRTRLSFDSNTAAVEAGAVIVRAELRDFAAKAADYVATTTGEWKRAAEEVRDIAAALTKRQRFYASRLRDLSSQLDANQSSLAMTCAESMDNDAQSMLSSIHELLAAVEVRLLEAQVVDPATNLMNRREMERRIALQRGDGDAPIQLMFQFSSDAPEGALDPVLRQVASRITSQLRPEDLVGRWGPTEFLCLFQGPAEVAERRGAQVAGLISGTYSLYNQAPVEVRASVTLLAS